MTAIRVVKLGGSLLDEGFYRDPLIAWLAEQPPAREVFVVGGGRKVDDLRRRQSQLGLTDVEAHWKAIEIMASNAVELQRQFPDWLLQFHLAEAAADENAGSPIILDVTHAMKNCPRARAMPMDWSVTSDSIAALVASELKALELVLLKSISASVPDGRAWVRSGLVDRYFVEACDELPNVRIVNLRAGR